MKAALIAVSLISVVAIGALAAVLITGWPNTDSSSLNTTDVVTDSQAVWCWTHRGDLAMAADALDIHNSDEGRAWGAWLAGIDAMGDRTNFDNLKEAFANARTVFWTWLEEKGHVSDDFVAWLDVLTEDDEIRRVCLAAWGSEFGAP